MGITHWFSWDRARTARSYAVAALILALAGCTIHIYRIPSSGADGASGHAGGVARTVDSRLVDINCTLRYQHARSAGTGIVLTSSGLVLTNNHVIRGATSILVTDIGSGRTYPATVVGYSESGDIALLRLRGAAGLPALTRRASRVVVGEPVVALGNAGGLGGTPSRTTGRVTGLGEAIIARDKFAGTAERLTGLIRTNARIQPGDSGGPLLTTKGRLIGINTAASAGFLMPDATQAFAIPVGQAMSIARRIEAGRASATVHIGPTGFLGVGLEPPASAGLPAGSGAVVASVIPGLPAARAGLAAGDVIVAAAGRGVASPTDIAALLVPLHPGDAITLRWDDRTGQAHTATVALAPGPAA